MTSLNKDKPI